MTGFTATRFTVTQFICASAARPAYWCSARLEGRGSGR